MALLLVQCRGDGIGETRTFLRYRGMRVVVEALHAVIIRDCFEGWKDGGMKLTFLVGGNKRMGWETTFCPVEGRKCFISFYARYISRLTLSVI